ncbi:MetQ/NlpA family ABC transporter substrate-binding protein [Stackebrandtia nassauensis]|uniref:Lipoprotein n=1 Tax=Stackebrandtia nassauensis (strain DSM 44728 / CIP 108903 / NRRL B-16338 / NBRC 102104 / LLR-40K-21) TaxID=446470 RepID=D3PYA2_STANL|nr:MetQ/NlpA family ABC transporter substrate-binding protein [Stackebrandtia nassauensis]ADD41469.1 NLPA lipoprotein [Stackebrandtia nassauensis DSM 44728]
MKRTIATTVIAGALAATSLTACAGSSDTLVVGASPTPHGELLEYIDDNLADKEGLSIEVKEFTDYSQPNPALANGDINANFFQHVPFLEDYNSAEDANLVSVAEVFTEPLGGYSSSIKDVKDLKDGSEVSIPNDATNGGRALHLLEANGLLKLKKGAGLEATESDIAENPKDLKIVPLEAAQLPRSLDDVDFAVINGNFALEADLKPKKDALILEDGKDNPYANVLVVREEDKDDEQVKKLAKLLNSDEVKKYLAKKFPNSIPAF